MSKKRTRSKGPGYLCRKCGGVMKNRDLICKRCRQAHPAAVKAHLASLRKALGGRVEPVAAPASGTVVKAAAARPQTVEDIRRAALTRDLCNPHLYHPDANMRNGAWYAVHPEFPQPGSPS